MRRERLLPDEKTLEKVARYEAHLSRGLYKAMHELEALQTRRTGVSLPWRGSTWMDRQRAKGGLPFILLPEDCSSPWPMTLV